MGDFVLPIHIKNDWNLVDSINRYAVLMGYVSMAIKGLGFLVLTWTTVVLLGGFVSTLHKNDFWSLTFIVLVQTAGIFDVALNEKLSYVMRAIYGLLMRVWVGMNRVVEKADTILVTLLACVVILVQVLVLAAVLCPLAIIYVFGILMSGGISLWRLKEHDYRGTDGEASNLPSAMDTLYCLALIQCVLFCSRYLLGRTGKSLADGNASECSDLEKQVLSRYLRETKKGCEADPSFAQGRDLSTHAIHMISSKSPTDCISGVEMLYTSICILERRRMKTLMLTYPLEYIPFRERVELKQLVRAATSSPKVVQKLLEMLDSIGLHDGETRKQAAKIVECLASNINLEQFPRGIHYISSLIGTFQEYSLAQPVKRRRRVSREGPVQIYKELLLRGLCIIRELASSENNCRVISDTQDLVSKIMAPLTSDLLNHTSHDNGEWSNIVEISVEVMSRLSGASGETGVKLRREISSCQEAISTLERIISCNVCKKELQEQAIQILTQLYMDTTEGSKAADFILLKKEFVRMVLDIFTDGNKSLHVRAYVGAALMGFRGGSNATIVIQTSADVVKRLTKVLLDDEDMVLRQHAAVILEHLWTYYTEHDNYLSVLKTEMSIAVGKVIKEITDKGEDIGASPQTGRETEVSPSCSSNPQNDDQDEKEKASEKIILHEDEKHTGVTKPEVDIENQNDTSLEWTTDEEDKKEDMQSGLLSSLLSVCGMVYDKLISEGSDLTPQFHNASIFLNMLQKIVVEKGDHSTVENLSLCKTIAKMVISMMKHGRGRFVVQREDLQSLIEALSTASKSMLDLDYSMIFSSTSRSETTTKIDKCTLSILVKEAQELYATWPSTSGSG